MVGIMWMDWSKAYGKNKTSFIRGKYKLSEANKVKLRFMKVENTLIIKSAGCGYISWMTR